MNRVLSLLVFLSCSIIMLAQATTNHTIQRGETIESIAEKYGVSVNALQQANPDTKKYFYVGMKLIIPQKATESPTSTTLSSQPSSREQNSRRQDVELDKENQKREKKHKYMLDGDNFTSIGVTIGSDFSKLVGITYGIHGQYFLKNQIGATLDICANYGLEDNPDVIVRIGPSYVYPLTDMLYVMGTACYTLTMAENNNSKGNISGASIIPTLGISKGKIRVGLNGDFLWRNGGNFRVGGFLNISYAI